MFLNQVLWHHQHCSFCSRCFWLIKAFYVSIHILGLFSSFAKNAIDISMGLFWIYKITLDNKSAICLEKSIFYIYIWSSWKTCLCSLRCFYAFILWGTHLGTFRGTFLPSWRLPLSFWGIGTRFPWIRYREHPCLASPSLGEPFAQQLLGNGAQ